MINTGLALVPGAGPIISTVGGVVIGLTEAIVTKGDADVKNKLSQIASDTKKAVEDTNKQLKAIKELKRTENLKYFLKEVEKQAKASKDGTVPLRWRSFTDAEIDEMTEDEVKRKLEEKAEDLKITGKFDKLLAFWEKHEKFINQASESVVNIAYRVNNFFSESDNVEKLIETNKNLFDQLNNFEKTVVPKLTEEISTMVKQFGDLGEDIGRTSKVNFDTKRKIYYLFWVKQRGI